jgi:hypothetical protein
MADAVADPTVRSQAAETAATELHLGQFFGGI